MSDTLTTTAATWADALGIAEADPAQAIAEAVMAAQLVVEWHNATYATCRNYDGQGDVIAQVEQVSGEWKARRGYHVVSYLTADDAVDACLRGVFGW